MKRFPIRDGVPRIVPPALQEDVQDTIRAFGWEWQRFESSLRHSSFDSRELFLGFIAPVDETFFGGKVILDAGCGRGRFTRLAAEFGAQDVIGVDMSSAVDVAYRNTHALPNAHVLQADIHNLPFQAVFDYIFSVGVIHHLPEPKKGFQSLLPHLKQNGSISIWVYGREHNEWLLRTVDPLRRHVTGRMPAPILNVFSQAITMLMYLALKLLYRPVNQLPALKRFRRFLFYNDYLSYLAKLEYPVIHSVVFDHLAPRISHYLSKEDVLEWFSEANFKEVIVTPRNENSWRGFGSTKEGTT
jgi:SAM-dependent methyltransferase